MINFAAATQRAGAAVLAHLGNARVTLQGATDAVPGRLTREPLVDDAGMAAGPMRGRSVEFTGAALLLGAVSLGQRLSLEELQPDGSYSALGAWLVADQVAQPDLGTLLLRLERA